MARTTIRTEDITADAVTAAKLASDAEYDDSGLQDDIALIGFKVAANGSLAKYDLVDQTVDDFQDASGVDASASTNETRDSTGKYYKGSTAATPSITSNHDSTGTDGDYTWYKWTTVTSSGSFVNSVTQDYTYLVVGGGGSGGTQFSGNNNAAGGGGAGGMITNYGVGSAQSLTGSTTYTITVGDGGAADPGNSGENNGNSGNDSSIAGSGLTTITGLAGGYGSRGGGGGGEDGGSGGGSGAGDAQSGDATQGNIGVGIGYGNDGGAGSTPAHGAGGGGAGESGRDGDSEYGRGGDGLANSITGASVIYAAGGGGGGSAGATTGGAGGSSGVGGEGGDRQVNNATAGDANTGSGGGAGGSSWSTIAVPSGAGGSGIVILRRETNPVTEGADLTLVSNSTTAEATPTKGDMVCTITNGAGTTTVNTDIKGWVSRDNGTTYTQGTLASQGTTGGHTILTFHDLDISGQPSGTSMRWKITTHNQSATKTTRIQAVSLGWS